MTIRPLPVLFALIAIATIVYPFIVFTSIEYLGASTLSLILFVLLVGRVLIRQQFRQPEQYIQLALVGSLCLFAAWQKSETLLRFYPVAMNFAFSLFFFLSLRQETTLIERFSQAFVKNPEPHQRAYMRGLTKVWAFILLINAGAAAYTACCTSLDIWTLYNGVISYVFFGLFSLAELINRYFYKKRHLARLANNQEPTQ